MRLESARTPVASSPARPLSLSLSPSLPLAPSPTFPPIPQKIFATRSGDERRRTDVALRSLRKPRQGSPTGVKRFNCGRSWCHVRGNEAKQRPSDRHRSAPSAATPPPTTVPLSLTPSSTPAIRRRTLWLVRGPAKPKNRSHREETALQGARSRRSSGEAIQAAKRAAHGEAFRGVRSLPR